MIWVTVMALIYQGYLFRKALPIQEFEEFSGGLPSDQF